MKHESHSKFTHAIHSYKLTVVWNDGLVEDLTPDLPETLRNDLIQHIVDMEDLRTQDPVSYSA